jgi:uncharacterized protein YhhL (DUF1145 family)
MAFLDDLSTTQVDLRDVRPGLRLRPLRSHAPKVTDAEIDHVIAMTLAESRQIEARAAMPEITPQDELLGLAGRNARREALLNDAAAARMQEVLAHQEPGRDRSAPVEDLTGKLRLRELVPWPRRAAIAVIVVAVFIVAPWAIPLLVLAALVLAAAAPVVLGTDRMAAVLACVFHGLDARWPDRAELFRARIDRLATAMDALLDRLPERWTTGLYMPDFSRDALLSEIGDDRPDPFERIAAEARRR